MEKTKTLEAPMSEALRQDLIDGKYRVINELGRGGMGIVYLAEQEKPIRRKVALKLIKAGLGTHEVLARFETERQALAIMSHPNIAKVFDAGMTGQGAPYFVMEYIAGVPINQFCDANKLSTEERLALFTEICDAVQHAHQKGVIHRDIKASNILVSHEGTKRVPKIIDFGVAKATGFRLTDKTLFTETGALLGTPEYMSPEQVALSPLDVDTRTDIYSLGVMLYELLTGVLPYDSQVLRRAALNEMQRIIIETDPPKPSTRLTRLGDTASDIAARRQTDVTNLKNILQNDLDWVVMHALEKDRSRRYATASEFALDIRRYLNNEPVLVGPPALSYKMKKFLIRHKGPAIATLAVLLVLVFGLVSTSLMFVKAKKASIKAQNEKRTAVWQSYIANINAADASLRTHETRNAKIRLELCDPSLRNWEWHYLNGAIDSSSSKIIEPGMKAVRAFVLPDGSQIMGLTWPKAKMLRFDMPEDTVIKENNLYFWDISNSRLTAHFGSTQRLIDNPVIEADRLGKIEAVSPAGRLLVSPSRQGFIVFDVVSKNAISHIVRDWNREDHFSCLLFSHDNELLAGSQSTKAFYQNPYFPMWEGGSGDGSIWVWQVNTGKLIYRTPAQPGVTLCLTFDKKNEKLASGSSSGNAMMWDIINARPLHNFSGHTDEITAIAISPDGLKLATGSMDNTIRIWDTSSGKTLSILYGHDDAVLSLAFSKDGMQLTTGSRDKTVRLWDIKEFREIMCMHGHEGWVQSLNFSAGDDFIVSGSNDGTIRIWSTANSRALSEMLRRVLWLEFSKDGSHVLLNKHGTAEIRDAESMQLLGSFSTNHFLDMGRKSLLINDKQKILLAVENKNVEIRELISGELSGMLSGHQGSVSSMAISPDDRQIATADSKNYSIYIWNASTRSLIRTLRGHEDWIDSMIYSPDKKILASASRDGMLRIWDTDSGEIMHVFEFGSQSNIVFNPDGRLMAAGSDDGITHIWDVASGRITATLVQHDAAVVGIDFSPDGSRIVTAGLDGAIRIWDSNSGEHLLALRSKLNDPTGIAGVRFSPDGKMLIAWSRHNEDGVMWKIR